MMALMTQQASNVQRLAYSLEEAAIASTLSRRTLYRMIGRGELQTVTRGKRRLVPSSELKRLCSSEVVVSG
jgi:excisionase family DNA binding protein